MDSLCKMVAEFTPSRLQDVHAPRKVHSDRGDQILRKKFAADLAKLIPIRGTAGDRNLVEAGSV
jgi:hypothetical protein